MRMRPFTLGKRDWTKATVTKRYDERSYQVETDFGPYRRNRVDLRQLPSQPKQQQITASQQPPQEENLVHDQAHPNHSYSNSPMEPKADDCKESNHTEVRPTTAQTVQTPKRFRPQRTIKGPAYLKDYVH